MLLNFKLMLGKYILLFSKKNSDRFAPKIHFSIKSEYEPDAN